MWSKCVWGAGAPRQHRDMRGPQPGTPSLRCPKEGAQCSQSMAGQWHTHSTVIRHHRAWLGTSSPCPTHPSADSISLINRKKGTHLASHLHCRGDSQRGKMTPRGAWKGRML